MMPSSCAAVSAPLKTISPRDAIAEMMGVEFDRDETIVERIRGMFENRGRSMPENNLRQADVPRGASVISQMPGTAPGLIFPVGDKVIYAVPGVPSEMKEMVNGTIVEDLKRRAGVTSVIKSRVVRTWGQSESGLAATLAARIEELDQLGNPTLAFQASGIEGIKLRITAKTDDETQALAVLDAEERRLRDLLGDFVFGIDADNMEVVVLNTLRECGLTLAVAESLTGGLVGARLTSVAGASDVFRGAIVSYAREIKHQLLKVPAGPVVSEASAKAMAAGVREVLNADIGIATTGVAGPTEPGRSAGGDGVPRVGRHERRICQTRRAARGEKSNTRVRGHQFAESPPPYPGSQYRPR